MRERLFIQMSRSQLNKRAYYTFSLTDEQIAKYEAWREEIQRTDKRSPGTIGGTFAFQFTTTTVGVITRVIYRSGEQILDLTNYDEF
jgi:hypothetical protein